MRGFQLSVRGKIMGAIIAVSTVVVGLGAWAAFDAMKEGGEARSLSKDYRRFEASLLWAGAGDYAAARLVAQDPGLVAALENGDQAAAADAVKRLSDALAGSIAPDLVVVSDAAGSFFPAQGVDALGGAAWRGTRLFQDLREGKSIRSKLATIGSHAFRVAGAPIKKGEGGAVVGTVLLGQKLDRFLSEFAENSGSQDPQKQQRMTLVSAGRVLASALPQKEWDDFERAAARVSGTGKQARTPEASRESDDDPTLRVDDKVSDFWNENVTGYSGIGDPQTTKLGTMFMQRTREKLEQDTQRATRQILFIFGIASFLALAVGYFIAVRITRPIRRYIAATEDLARGQGDLTRRLDVDTNDEIGVLARNLNRVFAKIHSLAAAVQRSAFQVGASSGEISTVSKQMLDGAKQQASKISSSTAAVTELSSSIQQVAENAAAATRTAKQSGEAVTRAIQRLDQIRRTVEDAAARIATLGESGKRIGNIVEVIRQISEQTTMLALNAAIEAAHAGEHGRGFAVVADEVSSLAKRVGQSARDIEDLIATIRDQTGEAVRVMQDGTREVEEGTGLVTNTLADLKMLISVIDDTASAVQEQAIASDEIARNMDAVQRIATEVLAKSENAVEQGDRLHHLAEQLEQSVKGFRIDPERVERDEAELAEGEPRAKRALPAGEA